MIIQNLINFKDIPKISCVYLLTNKINGKIYIGKANNLQMRMRTHLYNAKNQKDQHTPIKNAILKYGWENFSCAVLEEANIDILNQRETYYIDHYKSRDTEIGYNILRECFSRSGITHSEDTKKRISETCKKVVPRGERHYSKQKGNDAGWKACQLKNKGSIRPQWVRDKISKAQIGRSNYWAKRSIRQICPKTNKVIKIWDSISEAAIACGGKSQGSISSLLHHKPNKKGYYQKPPMDLNGNLPILNPE